MQYFIGPGICIWCQDFVALNYVHQYLDRECLQLHIGELIQISALKCKDKRKFRKIGPGACKWCKQWIPEYFSHQRTFNAITSTYSSCNPYLPLNVLFAHMLPTMLKI